MMPPIPGAQQFTDQREPLTIDAAKVIVALRCYLTGKSASWAGHIDGEQVRVTCDPDNTYTVETI